MKFLLHVITNVDVRNEIFDDEDAALDHVCGKYFGTDKEDENIAEIVDTLKTGEEYKEYDEDGVLFIAITITEVGDNFYVRKDGAECFACANVVIPTWNKVGLSLEVVQNHDEDISWKNIEISCGDNVDGTVRNTITIGGIDEENGAIEALRDFGLQIVRIADKMETDKD